MPKITKDVKSREAQGKGKGKEQEKEKEKEEVKAEGKRHRTRRLKKAIVPAPEELEQMDLELFDAFQAITENKAFKDLTKSAGFDEFVQTNMKGIEDISKSLKSQFTDACTKGDLKTVKQTIAFVYLNDLYHATRQAISNNHLEVVEYILDKRAGLDKDFYCNIWSALSSLKPGDPMIELVLKKENNNKNGFESACSAGNIALVDYFIGRGVKDYQWGLNFSVQRNNLELVKKLVALDPNLDIKQACLWISFSNPNDELMDYLESLSPGSTIQGMCDTMGVLFGFQPGTMNLEGLMAITMNSPDSNKLMGELGDLA